MLPDDGRVVSNFVVQALAGEPLTVYGDGSQTRSFCSVDDLVRGLVSLMALEDDEVGPVNLGNPDEVTILELAERIRFLAESSSEILHLPLPVDDPVRRCPDITLAQTLLDWSPRVRLDEGLQATVAYFRGALSPRETA
jgi:UDP-glucuronate decarboxylase